MNYPKYAQIEDRLYEINTDFRVAIKCNEIAQDESIGDYERSLAIIYLLFGEKGLISDDKGELLKKAQYFLSCGQEVTETNDKPDMDYIEDMDFIEASFMSDFHIDLSNTKMHWWKFNKYMNGLSNSDMGNCCILNRIRNLRNYDLREIKDSKERAKIQKAQEQVALKKNKVHLTKEQEESEKQFFRQIKGGE